MDRKFLLLGVGVVLMISGIVLSVIKGSTKQETKPTKSPPISKPETLPPPPSMTELENLPVPETRPEPVKPEETTHEKPQKIEKPVKEKQKQNNIKIVRVDEREAVIKLNGKVYVYERKKEAKGRSGSTVAKKQDGMKRSAEEKKPEQKERVETGLAIVCSGKSRECLLYEGAKSYRSGDSFRGARIEKIEIDRVYLSNGYVIRVE